MLSLKEKKMSKLFYPAIFHIAEEGGYYITFPDFQNMFTQADDMNEAYDMAQDALGLELVDLEKKKATFPVASIPSKIKCKKDESIVIIDIDLMEYKRKTNNNAVKKTLSIPSWLNEEAIAKGINFSAVLQKALKAELNL